MTTKLSQRWKNIQVSLFPKLEEILGALSEKHQRLVTVIEFARVERILPQDYWRGPGRPRKDRVALANSFIAKAVYNLTETKDLRDRLKCDRVLRRICGWEGKSDVPSESVFSRTFAEFAEMNLAKLVHETFIAEHYAERMINHISRDSTAIEAREKAVKKEIPKEAAEKKKRGRPKKGEERPALEPKRLELQMGMTLPEMLADLPKECDYGCKKDSKGFKHTWKGYKLHIDTMDGDIPFSAILTSASVHDSQVAIPLTAMTSKRITYFYELMDSAYDAEIIRQNSIANEHVAIIDFNRRSPKDKRCFAPHEAKRYKQRSSAERLNSNLKDNYGGRSFRVRGNEKIYSHLMFGLLAITIEQTVRLLT